MLTYLFMKTSKAMKGRLDKELKTIGTTSAQFAVMNQIDFMDNKALAFEIAQVLGSDRPTISAIIQRLYTSDIIYKIDNIIDRRSSYICLTQKGITMLKDLRVIADKISVEIFQDFSDSEQLQLATHLTTICTRLEGKDD